MKHEIYYENWWNMKYIKKIDEISPKVFFFNSNFLLKNFRSQGVLLTGGFKI